MTERLSAADFAVSNTAARHAIAMYLEADDIVRLLSDPEHIDFGHAVGDPSRWSRDGIVAVVKTNLAGFHTVIAFEREPVKLDWDALKEYR